MSLGLALLRRGSGFDRCELDDLARHDRRDALLLGGLGQRRRADLVAERPAAKHSVRADKEEDQPRPEPPPRERPLVQL